MNNLDGDLKLYKVDLLIKLLTKKFKLISRKRGIGHE